MSKKSDTYYTIKVYRLFLFKYHNTFAEYTLKPKEALKKYNELLSDKYNQVELWQHSLIKRSFRKLKKY